MKTKRNTKEAASTHKRARNDGDSLHMVDNAAQSDEYAAAGAERASSEEEASAGQMISAEGGSSIFQVEPLPAHIEPAGQHGIVSVALNETLKRLRRRMTVGAWELPLLPEVEEQRM